MALTPAQLQTLKTAINGNPTWAAFPPGMQSRPMTDTRASPGMRSLSPAEAPPMARQQPLIESQATDERLSAEDMASRRADEFLADALAVQARANGHTLVQRGVCAEYESRCHPDAVYCDAECRATHEQRLQVLARQGRGAA